MKTKKEQLSLFNLIWIGFSFIAGITYTASFSTILASETGVGNHIYWIFLIEGFVAYMCAWTFARLVQIHPEANGGGAQYVRTAFGKFWGLLMGMINYAVIPAIAVNLLVTMVRANFDNLAGFDSQTNTWGLWGSFGSLYLDLIAFGLCGLATSILFLGMRRYRIASTCIAYITWIITLLLVIFGIVGGALNLNAGNNGLKTYASKINVSNFSSTFTSIFFAFCGLEIAITSGKNIKNRQRNVPISIMVIMFASTLFYMLFTLIVMLAVSPEPFGGNPNLQIFKSLNNDFINTAGRIIVIICTLLMRFNSSLQVSLFGGSTLEPLAKQKFISKIFAKENKESIPVAGVLANCVVFIIACIMFIFIPDIVQGITQKQTPFDYATLASVASILLISIYMMIIPVAIYQGIKKNMKVRIWEYIGWSITIAFLIFVLGTYFYNLILDYTKLYDSGSLDIQKLFKCTFQLIYFVSVVLISVILYHVYHKKQIKKVQNNPELLAELKENEKVYTIIKNETK
ncbi:putative permease [Spiroplasma gladiatoris]|uniref:Putative permease n=1 Tax=Spiroplasma gladiatoris TaxID=2143 RepID=A0A4P7AIE3_9MOLU|nr:APC family permease [Spiroplasma gladiatoris]QBQ08032.1 putative permease [Spiroplasma gladiatoris]